MTGLARKLKEKGVLGINERNARFTLAYNPRRLYPLADNKLKTKKLACEHGIATPELYAEITAQGALGNLDRLLSNRRSFALKPCHGSGGEGILIIENHDSNIFTRPDGTILTLGDLKHHLSNILAGLYSLGGSPDSALIEYCVRPDPTFKDISFIGVPDIRIIVFLGVPVMAMLRLPTALSHGKANLHQGAVGVGIDLRSGTTTSAVWKSHKIERHPDTNAALEGIAMPHWETLLVMASRCYEINGLGYQGVDLVIDKDKGPLLLETNVRPGLSIQLANQSGLLPRLKAVERNRTLLTDTEKRIAFAEDNLAKGTMR